MKKYFFIGLATLLPIAITLIIVFFVINLLTQPFMGFFDKLFSDLSWFPRYKSLIHFSIKILFTIGLFFLTVLLGFLTRAYVFKRLLSFSDYIFHRIPFIKTVYKASQQVIGGIFSSTSSSFKQVVMVPFPKAGSYSIGFVSSAAPKICEETIQTALVTVFVPTTPNPTSGFLMLYKPEEIIYTDMKIEDALKYVISCGVISSDEVQK